MKTGYPRITMTDGTTWCHNFSNMIVILAMYEGWVRKLEPMIVEFTKHMMEQLDDQASVDFYQGLIGKQVKKLRNYKTDIAAMQQYIHDNEIRAERDPSADRDDDDELPF